LGVVAFYLEDSLYRVDTVRQQRSATTLMMIDWNILLARRNTDFSQGMSQAK